MRSFLKVLFIIPVLALAGCIEDDPKPVCGDNYCEGSESTRSCPTDCGSNCGDGACNGNETQQSCSRDCGNPPPVCGDGRCTGNETNSTCPGDCSAGPEPRVFTCGPQTGTCALLQNFGNCCGGFWVECPSNAGHYCAGDGLCYPVHCPASDFCQYTGVPCQLSGVTARSTTSEDNRWYMGDQSVESFAFGTGVQPLEVHYELCGEE